MSRSKSQKAAIDSVSQAQAERRRIGVETGLYRKLMAGQRIESAKVGLAKRERKTKSWRNER